MTLRDVCSGVWPNFGADPHAHTPRCRGRHREDTDDDRDQLPPRIFATVGDANCDHSKHGGDAGSGCRHPRVVAVREPAGENAGREDGQRPDRKRRGQPKDREHDNEPDENRDRNEPPHLSIVGGTAALVKPCDLATKGGNRGLQAFGLRPGGLLDERDAELRQPVGRIVERPEDHLALVDLETEDPRVVLQRAAQPVAGGIVGELVGDPLHELAADGDPGEGDAGRWTVRLVSGDGALLSSMVVTGSAVDCEPTTIGPKVAEALFDHRGRTSYAGDDEFVCCRPDKGTVLDHKRYAKTFGAALAKAEITDRVRPFHDGRHSAITHEAAAGSAPAAIQARAGHADFSTTQRYINLAGVVFRDEAERAEARILGPWVPESGTESAEMAATTEVEHGD